MIGRVGRGLCLFCVLVLTLAGCGMSIPADPDGTLDRVTGGTLRVGVSHQPPWTDMSNPGSPGGIEVDLVVQFAQSRDAGISWEVGGEEHLVTMLSDGQLDMVIGGLTSQSPWSSDAALTISYVEVTGPDGQIEQHVMATAMGENDFLTTLERFLFAQDVTAQDVTL